MLKINELNRIYLGVQGENAARTIVIDVSEWLKTYPAGTVSIWSKRNGETSNYTPTGIVFDADKKTVSWTPSGVDTFYAGAGWCGIVLTESGTVRKSKDIETFVTGSSSDLPGSDANTFDYERAAHKPTINGVELDGDNDLKTLGALDDDNMTSGTKTLSAAKIKAELDLKVDRADIEDSLTEEESGKVLDARQGKRLNDLKINRPVGVEEGKFLQTDSEGKAIWGSPASSSSVTAAVNAWLNEHVTQSNDYIEVEDTMTIPGAAADSHAVGARFGTVENLSKAEIGDFKIAQASNLSGAKTHNCDRSGSFLFTGGEVIQIMALDWSAEAANRTSIKVYVGDGVDFEQLGTIPTATLPSDRYEFTVPEGEFDVIRVEFKSSVNTTNAAAMIGIKSNTYISAVEKELREEISELDTQADSLEKFAFNKFEPEFTAGGYVNKNGGITTSASSPWSRTDWIRITGEYILFTCPMSSNQTQLTNIAAVAFYGGQTENSFISYVGIESGELGKTKYKLVSVPAGAAAAKFTKLTGTNHSVAMMFDLRNQLAVGNADNLLPSTGFRSGTYETNGITFDTKEDQSVVINGTATSTAIYQIVVSSSPLVLSPGFYTLSGCNSSSTSLYYLNLNAGNTSYGQLFGKPALIHLEESTECTMNIRVTAGATITNEVVRPMLERGIIPHSYFPSKYTNKNLYESMAYASAKNILPFPYKYPYPNFYKNGITFTTSADGIVTVSGTATADTYFMFVSGNQHYELPAGQYTLSGCSGGSLSTYYLKVTVKNGGGSVICTDAPLTKTFNNSGEYTACIVVKNGTTMSNVEIKPMLEEGAYAHVYKNPEGTNDVISIGGDTAGRIRNAIRLFHQPWTALKDIPYYEDETTEDNVYVSVPYASVFAIGGDVLYERNLATFYSAVKNPASIIYQPLLNQAGSKVKSNYGAVCTSYTGWINGMPLQVNAGELPNFGFKFHDYEGPESVAVGDCLKSSGHCIQIYDISVDAKSYSPVYIHLTDQAGSGSRILKDTIAQFEARLVKYGGSFKLGRYQDPQFIDIGKAVYATDIIPNMGDRTYYYTEKKPYEPAQPESGTLPYYDIDQKTLNVYIPDTSVQTIYLKKNDGEFTSIAKSGLTTHTINDTTVYDLTELTEDEGIYTITTNLSKDTKCQIMRISTGTISISDRTVTADDYSTFITPAWVQIFSLTIGTPPEDWIYPAPKDGLVAHGYFKSLMTGNTCQVNIPPDNGEYCGYVIRVYYQTGFGQAFGEQVVKYSNYPED